MRTPEPLSIETDLQTLSLDVGDDSIRKWLERAANHLGYKDK